MFRKIRRQFSLLLIAVLLLELLSACGPDKTALPGSPGTEPVEPPGTEPVELPGTEPVEPPTPFVLPAPSAAQYPGRQDFVPPSIDGMTAYDTGAVLTAWTTGDPASLTEYDRAIYSAAKDVLDRILTEGMSSYEKERKIYSWIVMNVKYDPTYKDGPAAPPEHFTPYGVLVNHTAASQGFAAALQLLMDMAGIECITIPGTYKEAEAHAWNMVRLDGTWCCLDAALDAGIQENKFSSGQANADGWFSKYYFNVTSDDMADCGLQWDYNNVPEAYEPEPGSGVPSAAPVQYPGRIDFIPPHKDDMTVYDTTAILEAWNAGDPAGLSAYDRAIYDAAKDVLARSITADMNDFEKEAALYTWVGLNVDYDWTHSDIMTPTPRESFTPYGGLVNHTSVCLGFASTFQLLMDMAGMECITVLGSSSESTSDHAWNMVKLDGNWYCTDVTWDANQREWGNIWTDGKPEAWYYNLATSDYMAERNHQWDYSNVPEAVYGWTGEKWVLPWLE